jgi:hypothetical protein
VQRPEGFDLDETWRSIVAEVDESRAGFRAAALADPEAIPWLRSAFGTRLLVGDHRADGQVEVTIRSWEAHTAAMELAPFVAWVEVVEPRAVREELAGLGTRLTERYGVARTEREAHDTEDPSASENSSVR